MLDDLGQANNCDLVGIDDEIATRLSHLFAADAEELGPGAGERPQGFDQLCAIDFARRLARGDEKSHDGIMTGRAYDFGPSGVRGSSITNSHESSR